MPVSTPTSISELSQRSIFKDHEPLSRAGKNRRPVYLESDTSRHRLDTRELNDSGRYDSSSAEAGVLVGNHLATARSLPKEESTITGGRVTQLPTLLYHRLGESQLTYTAASHP
ncbi:hypothetical protein AVEN_261163-1 [Araneus ventricosus]|uniref:Uncharacterized protein n=1 Tax=Araneus ventricosus TaxID=182803 RepID=A0A4Y2FNV3_ARAVE|nr:hypothetical protein AVEN_261163-1 [Araneus ventricosus]